MNTVHLLITALVVGAPGDGATWYASNQPNSSPTVQAASYPVHQLPAQPGIFQRLRNVWSRQPQPSPYHPAPVSWPVPYQPVQLSQPNSANGNQFSGAEFSSIEPQQADVPVVESSAVSGVAPSSLQVARKYEDKVGHDDNYQWITGHLFYVHADGGRWVLRYALPGEVDRFGGSVVLAPGVEMKNYREGDLVCAYGEVLNEARTSRSLGGALYRVNTLSIVERADP